ncbi:MAG: ABC transporter permease [Erysipelotrichaceae bacterium]
MTSILKGIFTLSFLLVVIRLSTPILFAGMSSFAAATTGIGNIGVEAIMTMSALFAVLGSYWTQSALLGLLIGMAVGVLMALMIAFFSMRLGANPTLVGIALNTFADSLAIFILYLFTGDKGSSASLAVKTMGTITIPIIKDIPVLGQILSGQHVLTYVCWICLIVFGILVFKTPLGLRMRSCGLNPDAAKTAGINVQRLQVLSLVFSGIFASLGGAFLSLNYLLIFSKQMVSGMGWMGIAANGIASGNYLLLIVGCLIFGIFRAVSIVFATSSSFPSDLLTAVPYVAVIVVIVTVSIVNYLKVKKGNVNEQ